MQDLLYKEYHKRLSGLLAAENKYRKVFQKLASVASTEELKSAIIPEKTEAEQHIARLKQCLQLADLKAERLIDELDAALISLVEATLKEKKMDAISMDIQILQRAVAVFNSKKASYEILHKMAVALQQDLAAQLLEQCAKDNQNNYAYLLQIAANIIYPKAGIA